MELEQRIRSLELEMKILKNEVQRTLMDVEEQIISNQLPVLKNDAKPSNRPAQPIQAVRTQPPAAPLVAAAAVAPAPAAAQVPATPVTPTAPEPPAAAPTPTAPPAGPVLKKASVATPVTGGPVLKQVSLEEIRAAQSELEAEEIPANSGAVEMMIELVQKPEALPGESSSGDAAKLAERGGVKLLEWLMSSATKVNGERDEKQVTEVLDKLSKLNSLVDRASTMEEALRLIEEAKLG